MDLITIVSLLGGSGLIGGVAFVIRKVYIKGRKDEETKEAIDLLKIKIEGQSVNEAKVLELEARLEKQEKLSEQHDRDIHSINVSQSSIDARLESIHNQGNQMHEVLLLMQGKLMKL